MESMALSGTKIDERFTLLDQVRAGSTAIVFRAFDNHAKTLVAVKLFASEGVDQAVVDAIWNRESAALDRLSHPCIVRLIHAGRDESSARRFIVTEWLEGETLESHFLRKGAYGWSTYLDAIGTPVLEAIAHAAKLNVAHRDLSPFNVMVLPSGDVKVIDFGQAKIAEVSSGRTVAAWHTPPYAPPEVDSGTYALTRDGYSWAALFVRAISGIPLETHEDLYRALADASIDAGARAILTKALAREPVTCLAFLGPAET